MDNKNRILRRWRDNENMDLDDMHNKAADKGWTDCRVETRELIQEVVAKKVEDGTHCAELLKSIEANPTADYFAISLDCLNTEATPIYDKKELYDALKD